MTLFNENIFNPYVFAPSGQKHRELLYKELVELEKKYGTITKVRRRIAAGDRDPNLTRYVELYNIIHSEVKYGEEMTWAETTVPFTGRHGKGKLKKGHK